MILQDISMQFLDETNDNPIKAGLVVWKNCWKIRTTLSALTIAILWKM